MKDYEDMIGKEVYGEDGEKVGTIDSLYASDETSKPEFATVKTGWFSGSSFIPLEQAEMGDEHITVPYTKGQVKDAPNIEQDRELSTEEERELYKYYGIKQSQGSHTSGEDEQAHYADKGNDTSSTNTDDATTRSEEELNIGKRAQETGRYRLRKRVVTENITKTVPVQREEVHVEREPITDENRDRAMSGSDLSEGEHEVVTHTEVPTVDKRVVPKERVRLNKETVGDKETVDEEVRKEQIDFDDRSRK